MTKRSMIEHLYKKWGINFSPDFIKFDGYESVYNHLDTFTNEQYDRDPDTVIDEVFKIYRSINLVPITYYTEDGIRETINNLCLATANPIQDNVLGLGNNQGQALCRFMFPNMMTAEPKGRGSNSLKDRFFDDTKLKRAIKICFQYREGEHLVRPIAMRRALELVTGENIQNFKAFNARSIIEELCPIFGGKVYDYSAGYGGRMLGAGTSRMHYEYWCAEPNTETVEYLKYLASFLRSEIQISCIGSESYVPRPHFDLAFSSPPYFNLEKYCDEPTQCMVKFKTLNQWFDGYVAPTISNIYECLNDDGVFATNIADYKAPIVGKYNIVNKWIKTAEKLGFTYQKTIKMLLNTRPGVGNHKKEHSSKFEGIYVFTK